MDRRRIKDINDAINAFNEKVRRLKRNLARSDHNGARSDQNVAGSDQNVARSDQNVARSDQNVARSDETVARSEEPSTSAEFQANEANSNGTRSATSRSARRRRRRRINFTRVTIPEPPQISENPNEINTQTNTRRGNRRVRKNVRRRQRDAQLRRQAEDAANDRINGVADEQEQNPEAIVENIPPQPESIEEIAASIIRNGIDLERQLHFLEPDYENCDYYAYDYETLEECAEELGPDETIEITIDCLEFIPMFSEYVPIRHYFENTRVVRLVRRCLIDTTNPQHSLPAVELLPVILDHEIGSDEIEIDENDTEDDNVLFSFLDPFSPRETAVEIQTEEDLSDLVFDNIETQNIKNEETEEATVNDNETATNDTMQQVAQSLVQLEKKLKNIANNMNEYAAAFSDFNICFSAQLNEERNLQDPTPEQNSDQSETDVVEETEEEVQSLIPDQDQDQFPNLPSVEKIYPPKK